MLLSIVVPVFNEEDNIEKFYEEVLKAVQHIDMDYEFIFVDDGSRDSTPLLLSRLTEQDSHVRALILARNFGHQLAITCGMVVMSFFAAIDLGTTVVVAFSLGKLDPKRAREAARQSLMIMPGSAMQDIPACSLANCNLKMLVALNCDNQTFCRY